MNILITGAASGIGLAAALKLAENKHTIYATTETAAQAKELEKKYPQLEVFKLDITNAKDREKVLDLDIDVLVNNAGVGQSGPLSEIPMDRVRENFEVNVFGTLELTQLALKIMLERDSGRIVVIGSVAGEFPVDYLGSYTMTKASLQFMYASLKTELKGHGVSVCLVEPGPYSTGFNEQMMETKWDWFSKDNLLWEDRDRMKKAEKQLLSNQLDVEGAAKVVVSAVESDKSKIYTAPRVLKGAIPFVRWLGR